MMHDRERAGRVIDGYEELEFLRDQGRALSRA